MFVLTFSLCYFFLFMSSIIASPLQIVISPSNPIVDCFATPGELVSKILTYGGNHKEISWYISSLNFELLYNNGNENYIIVGLPGIDMASCGTIENVMIKAIQ